MVSIPIAIAQPIAVLVDKQLKGVGIREQRSVLVEPCPVDVQDRGKSNILAARVGITARGGHLAAVGSKELEFPGRSQGKGGEDEGGELHCGGCLVWKVIVLVFGDREV